MQYSQHPLSAAFPAMHADEFQSLKDSIEVIGVQNPITLFEGMVIDGWHRYSAANDLAMACPVVDLGDIDPRDFVLAQNKARRHITAAQLALAVTSVHAWKPVGNPAFAQSDTEYPIGKTNAQLAAIAGVSEPTIKQAKAVQSKGSAAVQAAVKAGEIGLPKAAAIAKLPKEEQAAAIHKPAPKPAKPAHIEPEDAAYTGPSEAELQAAQDAARADLDKVMELMESDDPKAALLKENERLRMALAAAESQRDGYMNQANELIRRVKSLRKMLDKAQGK